MCGRKSFATSDFSSQQRLSGTFSAPATLKQQASSKEGRARLAVVVAVATMVAMPSTGQSAAA